jgi:S-adenosylmethionine:tRNA-ribosyltransferase-isomerase (queuine synthetase)
MDKVNQQLLLSDFDYGLPKELIAQTPLLKRDESKLLVVNRNDHSLTDKRFYDILSEFMPDWKTKQETLNKEYSQIGKSKES